MSSNQYLPPGTREALIGSVMEVMLYGVYLPIAANCVVILYRRPKRNLYLTITFITLFCLITARFIIDTKRTVEAYTQQDRHEGVVTYGTPNVLESVLTNSIWATEIAVSDSFIVYRVWVVWGKNWRIALLPALLVLGNIAAGIYTLYLMANFDPAANIFGVLSNAVQIFLYFTLVTNLCCTLLIGVRIWTVRRGTVGMRPQTSDPVRRMITVLVESAAGYTLLLIVQIATTATGSYSNFVFLNMTAPTMGIVFSYIILRASEGRAVGDTSATGSNGYPSGGSGPARHGVFELRSRLAGEDESARKTLQNGVQIQLERVTHQRVDGVESVQEVASEDKYHTSEV
ncbi:hypothetical protein FB451DRAFT_1406500 [Mycena latifolia]|nr:hypothetical protein FB451DRAFT_1406500 [Mycena latifolia]